MKLKGIILILSCEKYINTRVKKNFFDVNVNSWRNDWKFVTLKGDINLNSDYEYDSNKFILTVKCEDSYIHLLKKRVLGIKYVKKIFDLEEGILCCGDDFVFNKSLLIKYLNSTDKSDYEGKNTSIPRNYDANNKNLLKNTINDLYMYNYYKVHPEQMKDLNLTLDYLKSVCKRPNVFGAGGVSFYLSNKSCDILIDHMENINYNVFHYDKFTDSYPYTIEDASISFILYYHSVSFKNKMFFYTINREFANYLGRSSSETWYTHIPNLKWRL
jgi:hypothetical protein